MLSYTQLQEEIAFYLGWTRDPSQWTVAQTNDLDAIIQSGLRQFYWPPTLQDGNVVKWSFLNPRATVLTVNAQSAYTLPSDFEGGAISFNITASGTSPTTLVPVNEQHYDSINVGNPKSGQPAYYAIRPLTSTGTSSQSYQVLLYPTPDKVYTVSYRYDVTPPNLSALVPYPFGPGMHSETILESCLAIAEDRLNDGQTGNAPLHRTRFQELLASSIQYDKRMENEDIRDTWPMATTSTTLDITYSDLQRHVGQYLEYGWDSGRWSRDQIALVDDLIQSGLRKFYNPPAQSQENGPPVSHRWSFLLRSGTLSLVNATDTYSMPSDYCGGIIDSISYAAGTKLVHLIQITDDRLRLLQASNAATGTPQYYSIRTSTTVGTARQSWLAVVYPTPTASATISYQYVRTPDRLTTSSPYPLGGVEHAETIKAACLAAAEERMKPEIALFRSQFKELLSSSMQVDSRPSLNENTWAIEDATPTTLNVTYANLLNRVGIELGIGSDYRLWTVADRSKVDSIIQSGLRKFLNPPPVGKDRYGHRWSFLRPLGTMTLESGESVYELPSDCASIEGPLTFEPGTTVLYPPIEIVSEHEVRNRLSRDTSSGRPTLAAVRACAASAVEKSSKEIVFWPIPDADYVVNFIYGVNVQALSLTNNYPPGAELHAEAILESCLAVAEITRDGKPGAHAALYSEALLASVSSDRLTFSPEFIGYNRDESDERGSLHLQHGNSIVTYNGISY